MSRNLLHVNKLDEFRAWARSQGCVEQPPRPKHPHYQILRLSPPDGSGVIIFYLRLNAVHVTAPRGAAEELVQRWIRSRHEENSSTSPSGGGSLTCSETPNTSPPWA